jgi:hypothetical protein
MIRRAALLLSTATLAGLACAAQVEAVESPCELEPRTNCFGVESVAASLSTTEAGAHPEVGFEVAIKQDPESAPNAFGLHDAYATTRDIRIELPPGLVGDPNAIGAAQQCTVAQLVGESICPNGSQVGVTTVAVYQPSVKIELHEPLYMMQPPGGDAVARLGMIAGVYPLFINVRVRSESDYGFIADVHDVPTVARPIRLRNALWGVPAASNHDTERCTPSEVFEGCVVSPSRPPGGTPLPFWTNPTRCGPPPEIAANAASWLEPGFDPTKKKTSFFPEITECNRLPFSPSLEVEPTSHRAGAPTGLDLTIKLPASEGIDVLEPSQTRYMRIDFPQGLAINTGASDGLATCSASDVHFEEDAASECPNAAKLAATEFEVPVLERRLKGAIYLAEPQPGDPFRVWIVADDLGLHLKLPADLEVDKQTGQIHSIVVGTEALEGLPQAPLREVKLDLKSGFRAPLVNPTRCGEYRTHYEFTPWAGGPVAKGFTKPTKIDEGCESTEGFDPKLQAGTTNAVAGRHSPFVFMLTRQDGEQNPATFDLSLPRGMAATFVGIPHCEGAAAETGACPPDSRIGKVVAAVGAGPAPLWVPQAGKRPTAVYLGGPYKGAPTSIVAVVPRQAGPFDFGDEIVRSAVFVDPVTAQATAKTDQLPQLIEGIPIRYRTLYVNLDREGFVLNPTSCAEKATEASVTSTEGAIAHPSSAFEAVHCAKLGFGPKLSLQLQGGTHRGAHPKLKAVLKMPDGGANIAAAQVTLPHSEFIENAHFNTVCTRVQFAAHECPAGSVYGTAVAKTPIFDQPLEGPAYLRSSNHTLPDLVLALRGPPSFPIEVDVDGRVDSMNGGLRTTFESIPDAPVSQFVLRMQGGNKGLFVNSANLCVGKHRAKAAFNAQNGRQEILHPALKANCRRSKHRG